MSAARVTFVQDAGTRDVAPPPGPPTLAEIGEPPEAQERKPEGRAVRTLQATAGHGDAPLIRVIPSDDLLTSASPAVAWAIDGLAPLRFVTVLGAHGGAGKSVLALSWLLHAAAGREWAGRTVPVQRVAYVSFEDGPELVRARARRIMEASGLPSEALQNVMLLNATDAPPLMVEGIAGGLHAAVETDTFAELREVAQWAHGGCIVIDNASDAFGGNENARAQVRTFMQALAKLAREYRCAVILLLHIAKAEARAGSKGGESYSGSTAWHNSARSRLALVKEGGRVMLAHEKCNVARCADPISLRWSDDGVLLPAGALGSLDTDELDRDAECVLSAMRAALMAGGQIGTSRAGQASALATLRTYPEQLGRDLMRESGRLWQALNRLEFTGRIERDTIRTDNRKTREVYRLAFGADSAHGVAA